MHAVFKASLLALAISQLAGSHAQAFGEFDYDVFAEGKRLGEMAVSIREDVHDGAPAIETVVHTSLRAKLFFITVFSLDAEETHIVGEGGLMRHESCATVDGQRIDVRAACRDSVLAFEIVADGDTTAFPIPVADFDCSSVEGPPLDDLIPNERRCYRVLDLDRLEIVERCFTWVRDDTVEVDSRPVACRVIDVSDSFSRSRRWIARDELDILIQEEGADEDGPFRIALTRYPADSE